jgi:hypothetical protein
MLFLIIYSLSYIVYLEGNNMKSFNEWLTSKNEFFFHFDNPDDNQKEYWGTGDDKAEVIKLVSSPDLTIRKFPKTNNPAMADVLRNYARSTGVGLIDPQMGSMYLKLGDIYFIKIRKDIYFYQPVTDTAVDKRDNRVSSEIKEMLDSLIRKHDVPKNKWAVSKPSEDEKGFGWKQNPPDAKMP